MDEQCAITEYEDGVIAEAEKDETMNAPTSTVNTRRSAGNSQSSIGVLGEKTLHAMLKRYIEPDSAKHEVSVCSYVSDVVNDYGITEIQTRGFEKLRSKLSALLETSTVTVVYPTPKTKWLLWIDAETGEITKRRKSPKQGSVYDAVPELYKIKHLLSHPNFRLCVMLIDIEEYRNLDGWSDDKKRGSTRHNRLPVEVVEEIRFNSVSDYLQLVPEALQDGFTSKDYKSAAKTSLRVAQTALNILNYLEVVERVGKQGNLFVYKRADAYLTD